MENNLPIVEIYSKGNCNLCEEAKSLIKKVKEKIHFNLIIIDITCDSEIFEKYKYDIPVININGVIAFKHKVTEDEFIRKLKRKF